MSQWAISQTYHRKLMEFHNIHTINSILVLKKDMVIQYTVLRGKGFTRNTKKTGIRLSSKT